MKNSADLNSLAKAGIQFSQVDYLVEVFPAPIPRTIESIDIVSESDLFRMSCHEGYDELFVPSTETLEGETKGEKYEFERIDFIKWQLMRFSEETLFQLINKTDCLDVTEILDGDTEWERDPDYDPETWLNGKINDPSNHEKGLKYIARLRKEVPGEFYSTLIDSILDPNFGVLKHLETEISDNLDEVRQMYSKWDVPLMIVSKGRFFPYIDSEYVCNLAMDDLNYERMYVRNYDEGEIES